jgi:hypothetical protein
VIDPDSATIHVRKTSLEWEEISRWANVMLKKYRIELESESHSVDKVPALRARISLLKTLLNSNADDQKDSR